MSKGMHKTLVVFAFGILLLPLIASAESGQGNSVKSPSELKQSLLSVLQERETALRQLDERHANAALQDRATIEAQEEAVTLDYEQRYLTLLVEYDRAIGNTGELTKAQRALDALIHPEAVQTSKAALKLDGNVQTHGQEGVSTDEQK